MLPASPQCHTGYMPRSYSSWNSKMNLCIFVMGWRRLEQKKTQENPHCTTFKPASKKGGKISEYASATLSWSGGTKQSRAVFNAVDLHPFSMSIVIPENRICYASAIHHYLVPAISSLSELLAEMFLLLLFKLSHWRGAKLALIFQNLVTLTVLDLEASRSKTAVTSSREDCGST